MPGNLVPGRPGLRDALQAGPESFRPEGSSCRSCDSFADPGGSPAGLESLLSFFSHFGTVIYECKLLIFSDLYPKNACYTIYIMLCNVLIFR